MDFDELAAALRAWTAGSAHEAAAVELLIWGGWPRRADFIKACVRHDGDSLAEVDWRKARAFHTAGAYGSATEFAILDLAIAIGEDRYRLPGMGIAHRAAILKAVAAAMGMEDGQEPPLGYVAVKIEDFKPTGLMSLEEAREYAAQQDATPFDRWVPAEVREVPRG